MADNDAQRYERLYPGTNVPEAQKAERMQRIDHKNQLRTHGRTGRTRTVVFSVSNPWLDSLPSSSRWS